MTEELTLEALNKQIGYVSHEIRNHLSICDMYSQIIKRNLEKIGVENPSIENALDCIQKSISIIGSNLFDLKSLNNSTPQIFDFKTQVEKSVELAKAYVVDKDIEFEVFVKSSAFVEVDENKFLSCLVNILKNAIESIDIRGKIGVYAEIVNSFAVVRIANNGRQIPKDKQEQIFSDGFTTKKTGSGIGLALCKKYFNEIGGDIKLLKSTKEQTVFELQIPIFKEGILNN
jgi:signal transduction histidine kinase